MTSRQAEHDTGAAQITSWALRVQSGVDDAPVQRHTKDDFELTPVTAASKHEAPLQWMWVVQHQAWTEPKVKVNPTQAVMQLAIDVHRRLKQLDPVYTYYEVTAGHNGKRGKTRELWTLQELTQLFGELAEQRKDHPNPRASMAVANTLYDLYKQHTARHGTLFSRVPTAAERKRREQERRKFAF